MIMYDGVSAMMVMGRFGSGRRISSAFVKALGIIKSSVF